MQIVRIRIKERRIELGYTLLSVAQRIGVAEATVQRYESGAIKNIPQNRIFQLSEVLECSPVYLMGIEDNLFPQYRTSPPAKAEGDAVDTFIRFLQTCTEEEQRRVLAILRRFYPSALKDN